MDNYKNKRFWYQEVCNNQWYPTPFEYKISLNYQPRKRVHWAKLVQHLSQLDFWIKLLFLTATTCLWFIVLLCGEYGELGLCKKSIFLCIPSLSVSLFSIILHSNLYPPNWSNNTKTNLLSNQNNFIKIAPIIFVGVQTEKAMAPHSSSLAWKIPWMEEPGRLQFMG